MSLYPLHPDADGTLGTSNNLSKSIAEGTAEFIHAATPQQYPQPGNPAPWPVMEISPHDELTEDSFAPHPYFGTITKEDDIWMVKFQQAFVNEWDTNTTHEVLLDGQPFRNVGDEGKIPLNPGDTYWLNVKTDELGKVEAGPTFELQAGPSEMTEEFIEETFTDSSRPGDYWQKVVFFETDPDDENNIIATYYLQENIMWEQRPMENSDTGIAQVIARFEPGGQGAGRYILRDFIGSGAATWVPGADPSIYIQTINSGDDVQVSAEPKGVSSSLILTPCPSAGSASTLVFKEGMLKSPEGNVELDLGECNAEGYDGNITFTVCDENLVDPLIFVAGVLQPLNPIGDIPAIALGECNAEGFDGTVTFTACPIGEDPGVATIFTYVDGVMTNPDGAFAFDLGDCGGGGGGNGYNLVADFVGCPSGSEGTLTFVDGLLTNGPTSIQVGECNLPSGTPPAGYSEKTIEYCEDGVLMSCVFLVETGSCVTV